MLLSEYEANLYAGAAVQILDQVFCGIAAESSSIKIVNYYVKHCDNMNNNLFHVNAWYEQNEFFILFDSFDRRCSMLALYRI